ncbi:hypothetical protein D3875_03920 [Deinococcus cavernae]|uniref:Uncharacterized protein n=1 Tax=Deinococcus cavernae TaxID=2320857 RepID=A0A418VEE6_9DEIO|nr:hypothetical protein [Deinococcus cavernae]RJF74433.1 hypothetical protein D3875_03920 [Deinococcus cavernae]
MSTPEVTQLAATIATLFAETRRTAQPATKTLSSGLIVTCSVRFGEVIALTRKDGQSDMHEAATVARDAGWPHFTTEWSDVGQTRYLLIRPTGLPPEIDPHEDANPVPDNPSDEARNDAIRALLLSPGPWRQAAMSLHDPPEGREQVVANFRPVQLADWLKWVASKFPAEYAAYQGRHPEHLPQLP